MTYQLDSSSAQVAGTQLDCTGIVSGNSIGSITVVDGTDTGNSVNDVVEMIPTAAWGQDLADALTNQHTRTGTHTGVTTDTLSTTSNVTVGGTLGVTGATTFTGALGGAGYDAKTLANSYKFSVYRNAATSTSNVGAVIPYDTKLYDTGTNIDVVTNKGRFTAPIAGYYVFSGGISIQAVASSTAYISILKNGSELYRVNATVNPAGTTQSVGLVVPGTGLSLAANDYIELFCVTSANTETVNVGLSPIQTFFSGFLLSV